MGWEICTALSTAKPFLDDDDDEDDDCAAAAVDMHQHQPREELLLLFGGVKSGEIRRSRCCPNKAMMRLQLGSVGIMTRPDSGHTS